MRKTPVSPKKHQGDLSQSSDLTAHVAGEEITEGDKLPGHRPRTGQKIQVAKVSSHRTRTGENRIAAEEPVGDAPKRTCRERQAPGHCEGHEAIDQHDVLIEQQEAMCQTKHCQQAVAADEHAAGFLYGVALAMQAGRNKTNTESRQHAEHGQSTHSHKHAGKHRGHDVEGAIGTHTAHGGAWPHGPLVHNPALHGVRHGNPQ